MKVNIGSTCEFEVFRTDPWTEPVDQLAGPPETVVEFRPMEGKQAMILRSVGQPFADVVDARPVDNPIRLNRSEWEAVKVMIDHLFDKYER